MLAKREVREYSGRSKVWVGKYKNLTNLPHWHDDYEIVYVESGNAQISIDGETFAVKEDDSVFISPRSTHCIISSPNSILIFFLFDNSVLTLNSEVRLASPVLKGNYNLPAVYDVINAEQESSSPFKEQSVQNRVERLAIDIFSYENLTHQKSENDYYAERYRKLLADIDARYADYSLAEASLFVNLSESYFSKFFKRMANMTFSQYLNLVRVEKAIEKIRGRKNKLTSVAIACGFGTIRNFNRIFKEITGYPPSKLPGNYDALSSHPTYGVESSFNPTNKNSELL